ncbi:hypothetical protein WJX81_007864 [Elliptochloris bilobata]|uniref:Uncharacterized protein n=1 Tax=Elliptochloris bilobata TaxID=381761 RepID=A0AAW1RKH9_9CHLO
MATTTASFESGHADMVHDVQLDYYGRRLATCSSDRTIKVFDVAGEQVVPLADLAGHEGPVWQVTWAHPKFGSLLASCSFDHRVIVWKEAPENTWTPVHSAPVHSASVNGVAFAPHELGLLLAAASSDGSLSVLAYQSDGTWASEKIEGAHPVGAMAVSWSPAAPPGSLVSAKGPGRPERRFASAGCDNTVKVWRHSEGGGWQQDGPALAGHSDWVRDVAWAPNLGLPANTLASAGQDGRVFIWAEQASGCWERTLLQDFQAPVWRVSWSVTGGVLSVSDSSGGVTLWKEALDGEWQQLSN